jgi:hypothetical protein
MSLSGGIRGRDLQRLRSVRVVSSAARLLLGEARSCTDVDRSRPVGALTKPVSWSSSSGGEGENEKVTLEGEVPGVAGVVSRVGSSAKPLDVEARGAKG